MLAVWALLAAELVVFSISSWQHIAGVWELTWGSAWLAPGALLLSALVGLVAERVFCGLASSRLRSKLISQAVVVGAVLAIAWGLTQGRHFELWWRRAGFIGLCVASAVALAWWVGPRLRESDRRVTVTAGALIVAFELANRFVLVRLYPAFHWALTLLALAAAVALVRSLPIGRVRRGVAASAGAVLLISLALLPWSAERFSRFDNYRWLLLERAPLLGHAVHLLGMAVPPPPLEAPQLDGRQPTGARLKLQGKDVLLITIDALRADHVGAYGYEARTTPEIDALAAESVRFEYAYSSTPHTSYSVTSLMTGKYIRPLLLQGAGKDSETWASLLRRYGYRTAAFYPPAVFFIDPQLFAEFEQSNLGFEYQKKEFLEGAPRVAQVKQYLEQQAPEQPLFVWVHLFGPHEPYERHAEFDFGDRDIDRYDGEIAAADHTAGELVRAFRKHRPDAVVILSADHGEEFGEHGGRYHGSSVYEEQVRVPLLISAPGVLEPGVHSGPVQTIDLLPTLLSGLSIPKRPRIRGRDLSSRLLQPAEPHQGFAYAETESQTMLAEGTLRLLCARRVGACRLFDLSSDPGQQRDVAGELPEQFERLKRRIQQHNASHGQFEQAGLRQEQGRWPPAILRGIAGDGDAALEIAALLDDAEVSLRRKAAELLFKLARPDTVAALSLALERDEDEQVQNFCALALTRLGLGAARTLELLRGDDLRFRRLAALVLAETGDRRGHMELVGWWQHRDKSLDFEMSQQVLAALGKARSKEAVWPLVQSLDDVRLRPQIAKTLAQIGDETARGPLAKALQNERYHSARVALAEALVQLDAGTELVNPLRRWLGVPDPLENGLRIAMQADLLEHVGGPTKKELARARDNAEIGEVVRVVVPKGGNGSGLRLLVRANNPTAQAGHVRVGLPYGVFSFNRDGKLTKARKVPEIHPKTRVALEFPAGDTGSERWLKLPQEFGLEPGRASHLVVLAETGVNLEALAVVPLQDEPGASPAHKEKTADSASVPGNPPTKQ